MTTTPPTGDDGVEDLPSPNSRSTVRRLRLDMLVGGAGLVVILLLTRHHGSGSRPAPAASGSASSSATTAPPPVDESLAVYPKPDRHAADAARCPRGFDCPVSNLASAGTHAALVAAFPGARITAARTVRSVVTGYGQAIWTVDLRAVAGDTVVVLRLQPRSPTDVPEHHTTLFGGHAITHWESFLSQLLVVINVVTPADQPASLAAIEQLARDARMLSPW